MWREGGCGGAPLNVLHVFAEVQVVFAGRQRLEAVVATVADLRLGTLRATRLVYPVIETGRSYAFAASVEEPSIGVRAH